VSGPRRTRGGRLSLSVPEWVELARTGIVRLLEAEHAAVWDEVEAKLSDRPWADMPSAVDPHHLTTARIQLTREGVITETGGVVTRGGRPISVLHLVDTRGRRSAITKAAARKRLLHARYLRWAYGDKSTAALLGRSGERVARASLIAAAPIAGYRPVRDGFAEVRSLFDEPVPGGPLDSGAYLPTVDDQGVPGPTVVVPVEVKNRRTWLYPNSAQLYQLLFKAASLQQARPDTPFLPVLICRRSNITTFRMAEELGFFVLAARRQFIDWPEGEDARLLEEVRTELGYEDLTIRDGNDDDVTGYLARAVPKVALRSIRQWEHFGPALLDHFRTLRREIPEPSRSDYVRRLHQAVRDLGGEARW
jgi:hypothetical protein